MRWTHCGGSVSLSSRADVVVSKHSVTPDCVPMRYCICVSSGKEAGSVGTSVRVRSGV
jgi:hypothetical protein